MSKKNKTKTAGNKPANQADPDLVPITQIDKAKKAKAKEKKTSGLDAAAQVLKAAGEPMRCKDMVETMLSKGMWKTGGKTPAATIYSAILREMQVKGKAARFKKTDRGMFAFNG